MPTYLGVGEAARRLGVNPKVLTDAFYRQELRDDVCPFIAGRRAIPSDHLGVIAMILRRKGIAVRMVSEGSET